MPILLLVCWGFFIHCPPPFFFFWYATGQVNFTLKSRPYNLLVNPVVRILQVFECG